MKEKTSDIKNQKKATVVELDDSKKHLTYNLILIMGVWRKIFTHSIRNILISKALNHCVRKDGLVINGYWITNQRIYLIVKCRKYTIKHTLEKFAKRLNRELKKYLRYKVNPCKSLKKRKRFLHKKYHWKLHFEECILRDENIIKLLTGQKVQQKYYSPYVAQLEELIENYNYCSALDYTGAEGPVIVKQLKKGRPKTNVNS